MSTNRLNSVADRQRVNHLRDFLFVIMVAVILVFQVVSLSQARATSQIPSLVEESAKTLEVTPAGECTSSLNETVAALSRGAPVC